MMNTTTTFCDQYTPISTADKADEQIGIELANSHFLLP